jgi:hypothetical protein
MHFYFLTKKEQLVFIFLGLIYEFLTGIDLKMAARTKENKIAKFVFYRKIFYANLT